jgi:hypothetical protein
MRRTNKLLRALKGWEFDIKALRESEGAFSSLDRRSPRADITNVHPSSLPNDTLTQEEWCEYAGLPSPKAYMTINSKY